MTFLELTILYDWPNRLNCLPDCDNGVDAAADDWYGGQTNAHPKYIASHQLQDVMAHIMKYGSAITAVEIHSDIYHYSGGIYEPTGAGTVGGWTYRANLDVLESCEIRRFTTF